MEIQDFFQLVKVPMTIAHVLSVVLGMGAALTSDLLFSFYSRDKKLNETEISTLSMLSKIVFYGLILITITGVCIFLSDVEKYISSTKFLVKMSILAVLLINGYFLTRVVWPHLLEDNFFTHEGKRNIRRLAFACGSISVISWVAICSLGVIDSMNYDYSIIMSAYGALTALGILFALAVERFELN